LSVKGHLIQWKVGPIRITCDAIRMNMIKKKKIGKHDLSQSNIVAKQNIIHQPKIQKGILFKDKIFL